jgi:hypothetical protein
MNEVFWLMKPLRVVIVHPPPGLGCNGGFSPCGVWGPQSARAGDWALQSWWSHHGLCEVEMWWGFEQGRLSAVVFLPVFHWLEEVRWDWIAI